MMNTQQIINLIQSIGKIGGTALGMYGATQPEINVWTTGIGFAIALLSFFASHVSAGKMAAVLLCCLFLAGAATGCTSTGTERVRFGVLGNGVGLSFATPAATNSYRLVLPVNMTNLVNGLISAEGW
jgi:hypothetical protein